MASVFVLLEAFNRKEAAALGFFPCATASLTLFYFSPIDPSGAKTKRGVEDAAPYKLDCNGY